MKTIAYVTPIVLLVLAIAKPRSKLLLRIICIYMWIMLAFNTNNGDFESYYRIYNAIKNGFLLWHFEPAFSLLMRTTALVGLDYLGFKAVFGFIYVVLLYRLTTRNSSTPTLAVSLYMIFPFIYNISVLRSGIAGLIVSLAFCNFADGGIKAKRNFIIGVVIASLFHYSALLFILIIFVDRIQNPRKVFLISLVYAGILLALVYSGAAYSIVSVFTQRAKSLQWLSTALYAHLNLTGITFVILIFFLNYYLSALSCRILERNELSEDNHYIKLCRMARAANCAMFVVLPFALMSDVLLRYLFELMAVNICVLTNSIDSIERQFCSKSSISLLKIIAVFWVIFLFIYNTLPYLGTDISAFNTIYNNLIYGQQIPY